MPYAAISYRVKRGHEDEIAEMFAGFRRVDTPVLGDGAGRLLGTAVFIADDVVVRVIHYEGDLADVARHMAGQKGVHLIEERLAPYLCRPRDTGTPEQFAAYFRDATMRCISQLSIVTHPGDAAKAAARPVGAAADDPVLQPGLGDFLQLGTAFCGSKVLLAALELDLFAVLQDAPATELEIRQRLGLHPRGTRHWLDALVGLGVLERSRDHYRCTPAALRHLVPGQPAYVGGFLTRVNQVLYPAWERFTTALRTGRQQSEVKEGEPYATMSSDPGQMRAFLEMMDTMNGPLGPELASLLPWEAYSTLADLGGARGNLAAAIADRHPHLTAAVFDLPQVEPFFCEHMQRTGLSERVRFVPGDFFTDPLPEADVVVIGHVLHNWSVEERRLLVRKAYQAVRPGGALLVYDPMLDRCEPSLANLLVSLDMLLTTRGGSEYQPEECRSWLAEAGFSVEQPRRLGFTNTLIVGHKDR
jgi:SAM-dependent methyltransferase